MLKKNNQGFTLIEILIVVALMGAIVVGLLATLDPFQQIRKGVDTTRRSMASDLYRAFISYQAVKGNFPWSTGGNIVSNAANSATVLSAITDVMNSGDLKADFINLSGGTSGNLAKIYFTSVTDAAGTWTLNVCYSPESKSFKTDPNTMYNASGGAGTNCGSSSSTCFYCIK